MNPISRRKFIESAAYAAGGILLNACQPSSTPTVAQSQTVAPAKTETIKTKKFAAGTKIAFWSHNYGDTAVWQKDYLEKFAANFKEESGVDVEVQIVPWANSTPTWLTVAQGGAAPDCADMNFLYSYAGIGGGKYGPQPIDQYKDLLWPDLKDRFMETAMKDSIWQGKFFGIVWRSDIRPMIYRTDFLKEAGFSKAPDTWKDLVDMAKATTVTDKSGNVTRWGFMPGSSTAVQNLMPLYWQVGGEFMSADGKKATIDNPEMREMLRWVYDMIWTHKVMPADFMEKNINVVEMFSSGKVAIVASAIGDFPKTIERDFSNLENKWTCAIPAKGAKNRAAYMGATYWGSLYGSKNLDAAVRWIEYLSRDENMQKISEYTGLATPNKKVMSSVFWTQKEWRRAFGECQKDIHPSQHPTSVWSKISAGEPGAVLHDLFYSVLVKKESMEDSLKTAQKRLQEELDKA